MENDILDSLNDIGYEGPLNDEKALLKALEGGPKSLEYTKLVHILSEELKNLYELEESVSMMYNPKESSSFLLELSSFLKELGCPYKKLLTGYMSSRLEAIEDRILLLDYLLSELMAARMVKIDCPKEKPGSAMEIVVQESPTARDLKDILISLKFNKPPPNITVEMLFSKLEAKLKETIQKEGEQLVGKPLCNKALTEKDWKQLEATFTEMYEEYRLRKEMLITRLECTIQSFEWADRLKTKKDLIQSTYCPKKEQLKTKPDVKLSDFLAARTSLLQVEKTSSVSVRKYTQSDVYKVIIGQVPDRGGRPNEQQPPAPEMPSWQQRSAPACGRGGGGSGGGGSGGGGSGRGGGRVQGGYDRGGGDHRPQTSPVTFAQQNQRGYQTVEVPLGDYNQNQGYNQSQGVCIQNHGGYNQNQGSYNQNEVGYGGYNQDYDSMGSDNQGYSQGEDVDFKFNVIEGEMDTISEILASENVLSNNNNSEGYNRSDSPQEWNESADMWSSDTGNVQDFFHKTIKQEPIDSSNTQEDNETSNTPGHNDNTTCNVDQSYEGNAFIQTLNANMKVEIKLITKEIQDEIDSINNGGDDFENSHIKPKPGAEKNAAKNIKMKIKNRIDENIQNIEIKTEPITEENQTKSSVLERSNKDFTINKEIKEEIGAKIEPGETEDIETEGVKELNLKDRLVFAENDDNDKTSDDDLIFELDAAAKGLSLQYFNSKYKPYASRDDAFKPKLCTVTNIKDFFTNKRKIRFNGVQPDINLKLVAQNRIHKMLYSLLLLNINIMDAIQLCQNNYFEIMKRKVHARLHGKDIICTPEQLKLRKKYFANIVKEKYRKQGRKNAELLPESDIEDEALQLFGKDEIPLTQRLTDRRRQNTTRLSVLDEDNDPQTPNDEYDVKPHDIKTNPHVIFEIDIEITIKDTKPLNEDDLTTIIDIIFAEADSYAFFCKPRFHDWFLRDDCIVLKCYNFESKKWLDSFISYCRPWPEAELRIVDFKVFTKRISFTVTKAPKTFEINEYLLNNNEELPGKDSKIFCTYLFHKKRRVRKHKNAIVLTNMNINTNEKSQSIEQNEVLVPTYKNRWGGRRKRKRAPDANIAENNSDVCGTPKNIENMMRKIIDVNETHKNIANIVENVVESVVGKNNNAHDLTKNYGDVVEKNSNVNDAPKHLDNIMNYFRSDKYFVWRPIERKKVPPPVVPKNVAPNKSNKNVALSKTNKNVAPNKTNKNVAQPKNSNNNNTNKSNQILNNSNNTKIQLLNADANKNSNNASQVLGNFNNNKVQQNVTDKPTATLTGVKRSNPVPLEAVSNATPFKKVTINNKEYMVMLVPCDASSDKRTAQLPSTTSENVENLIDNPINPPSVPLTSIQHPLHIAGSFQNVPISTDQNRPKDPRLRGAISNLNNIQPRSNVPRFISPDEHRSYIAPNANRGHVPNVTLNQPQKNVSNNLNHNSNISVQPTAHNIHPHFRGNMTDQPQNIDIIRGNIPVEFATHNTEIGNMIAQCRGIPTVERNTVIGESRPQNIVLPVRGNMISHQLPPNVFPPNQNFPRHLNTDLQFHLPNTLPNQNPHLPTYGNFQPLNVPIQQYNHGNLLPQSNVRPDYPYLNVHQDNQNTGFPVNSNHEPRNNYPQFDTNMLQIDNRPFYQQDPRYQASLLEYEIRERHFSPHRETNITPDHEPTFSPHKEPTFSPQHEIPQERDRNMPRTPSPPIISIPEKSERSRSEKSEHEKRTVRESSPVTSDLRIVVGKRQRIAHKSKWGSNSSETSQHSTSKIISSSQGYSKSNQSSQSYGIKRSDPRK